MELLGLRQFQSRGSSTAGDWTRETFGTRFVEVDGPIGHIEGLTLRLYNRETHQWGLYWANSKDGKVVVPQIGQFKDRRGEFYAQDTRNDRSILVRFDWTNMSTSKPHFEQSFSDDGGKTWEVNWITDQTRVPD
jgi:hypothetical protein